MTIATFQSSRKARRIGALALLLLGATVLTACGTSGNKHADLDTDAKVDLQRYMGAWHVIANIPYFAEKGKVATRDEYALREDGRIDNVFVYRKGFDQPVKRISALARVVPGTDNARWKIRFFGIFNTDYLILEVDPEYRWALIGHPSRKYAWVFSRTPAMDDAMYQELLLKLAGYGYDPSRLERVPQFAEQVGQPGFQ